MEKILTDLLGKAPELFMTLGPILLIIYIVREYRKIRQENEQSIKDVVNAKLGDIMSSIQSQIARLEIASKDQESKAGALNTRYEQFTRELNDKAEMVNSLFQEAQEKLNSLKEAIPSADEFSARDLLGIAQNKESSQAKAELCAKILNHTDATSEELELAGDIMRNNNRYALSLELYKRAHEKDPERKTAQVEYLTLLAEINYDHREESLTSAIGTALAKPDKVTFARIANALIHLDRYMALIEFSERMISTVGGKNPTLQALALRNMAVGYKQIGEIDKTINTYTQAFAISPEDENTLKPYLGLLEEQGKNEEYLSIARKLIEIDPSDVNYYRIYISSLIKKGDFTNAGIWLKRAKALPKNQMDQARLIEFEIKINAAANNTINPGA